MIRDSYIQEVIRRAKAEEDLRRRIEADEEDAVVFLAATISEESKAKVRKEIEKDETFWWTKHHSGPLGVGVRNALRTGGFSYDSHTMDAIWCLWLENAVYLPKEKIDMTDSIKERIKEFEEYHAKLRKKRKEEWRRRKETRWREYLDLDLKDPDDLLKLFLLPVTAVASGFLEILICLLLEPLYVHLGVMVGGCFILLGVIWATWKYAKWKYSKWKHKKSSKPN